MAKTEFVIGILIHDPECPCHKDSGGETGSSRSGTKPMTIGADEFAERWQATFGKKNANDRPN